MGRGIIGALCFRADVSRILAALTAAFQWALSSPLHCADFNAKIGTLNRTVGVLVGVCCMHFPDNKPVDDFEA
eukprot:scaffold323066_cov18-Prasinocladus_malaysianus.AAC.1